MSLTVCGRSIDRLLVLGYGVTGRAVVRYAVQRGLSVSVSERGELSPPDRAVLRRLGVAFEDGGHSAAFVDGADAIVPSPGIPMENIALRRAAERGIPWFSEIDLAASALDRVPILAVTGTNGKSTVVSLIGALLAAEGLDVPVVGNIGEPFVALVDRPGPLPDAAVVEISSYQLEQSRCFRPRIGVLLNLSPDHLARHGSFAAYAEAKSRLFVHQTRDDVAILPRGLFEQFSLGEARRVAYDDPPPRLPAWANRLAPHHRADLCAAIAACLAFRPTLDFAAVPRTAVDDAFGLPFRMQEAGTIDGVRVINDSKSTNADSAVAALRATDGPSVLLLGGRFKGGGYEALAAALADSAVRRVILFGEAAEALAPFVAAAGVPSGRCSDLAAAVGEALAIARRGDTILFSPGCSSYDEFASYVERGRAFDRLVRRAPGYRASVKDKDVRSDDAGHVSSRS